MLFKNINYLSPEGKLIKNAFVLTEGEIIKYVGKDMPLTDTTDIYDGTDKLLLPGFVNTHCHVPMVIMRGLGGSLPLDRWLSEAIFPTEAKLDAEDVYYGALLGIGEMIKSGITSFNDMYYFSNRICDAVIESGISANIAMDGFAFDPALNNRFSIEKDALTDLFSAYNGKDKGRLKIDMCIHAEYTTTYERCLALSNIAKELGANVQLHLSETSSENNGCIERHGKTPSEYFEEMGLFENKTTAAHCVHLTDNDIEILKRNSVTVAHCPISNLKLASGFANIAKLNKNGVNVTIGTDGAASNDNLNILEEIKTASMLQKALNGDAALMPPNEILKMATVNGAISQGRQNTGKIAEGYYADLVVADFDAVNMTPAGDMLNTFVYSALPENIVLTMCRGKEVYRDGIFKTIDIEKAMYEVKTRSKRLV